MPYLYWETSSKQNDMELFCSVMYLIDLFGGPVDIANALKSLKSYDINLLRLLLEAYDEKKDLKFLDELTPEKIEKLKALAQRRKRNPITSTR